MSSQTSLGMGSGLGLGEAGAISSTDGGNLTAEGGSPPCEVLYDFIAYVIYCADHEKVALIRTFKDNQLRAVWFPFVALSTISSWSNKIEEGVQLILKKEDPELEGKLGTHLKVPISTPKRLLLHRVQVPGDRKFITRMSFFVRLEKSPDFKCCENTKRIQWYSVNEVINGLVKKLWGHDVRFMSKMCKTPKSMGVREYTLRKAFLYTTHPTPQNREEEILKEMGYGPREVSMIYADFLEHCFPSTNMTIDSFKDYLIKYGYNTNDCKFEMLFNTFDCNRRSFLEFNHVLYGLLIMEPKAPHRWYRLQFIFRYYDVNRDEYLNLLELSALIQDIFPTDETETVTKKAYMWLDIMETKEKDKCTFEELSNSVKNLKLRGTSCLCRSPKSILTAITKSTASRESLQMSSLKVASKLLKDQLKDDESCGQCRVKKYGYTLHSVAFNTSGGCVDARLLNKLEETEVDKLKPPRLYSMKFMFNTNFVASILMDNIREFIAKKQRTKQKEKGEFTLEESPRFVLVQDICTILEHIFSTEERVIKISGPTYVLGDIHGNLTDLLAMESNLWKSFPVISANYVFLGNYVNYGKWSVECILYLFCLKILSPNKVFLLRGRHEIRDIQIQNNFQRECFEKYNEIIGKKIWQMINNLFDRMPFALIVDENIFCAHSGIPNTKTKIQEFKKINAVLKNPSVDSPVVWQLLTNEPTAQPLKTTTGFSENQGLSSRFLFNEVAVNAFLGDNDFTHIVCGNRQTPKGYEFHFGGKLITVFSTSDHKNSKNKSAALLLFNHNIHIIRLEIPNEDIITKI